MLHVVRSEAQRGFPRAVFPALTGAGLSLLFELTLPHYLLSELFVHPYPFQVFAYIVAFALVFRTNVAYNRFWEMATSVTLMGSKWGDAACEAITFDELPRGKEPADRAKKLAARRRFQALMVRRYSLMHACALQYLRRDDQLDNLSRTSVAHPTSVPLGLGAFGGMQGPTSRKDANWQLLERAEGEAELAAQPSTGPAVPPYLLERGERTCSTQRDAPSYVDVAALRARWVPMPEIADAD